MKNRVPEINMHSYEEWKSCNNHWRRPVQRDKHRHSLKKGGIKGRQHPCKMFYLHKACRWFCIRYWWRNGSVIRIMRHYGVRPLPNALLKCSPGLSFCIIHPNKHNTAAGTEHLAPIPRVHVINGHRGGSIVLCIVVYGRLKNVLLCFVAVLQ